MKIKGVMNDRALELEETAVMAIHRLCDVFKEGNPKIEAEDESLIASNGFGTILFRGTADEMRLLKEASRQVVTRHDAIRRMANGSSTEHKMRIDMDNLKDHINDALEFRKYCAPKASLTEALYQMAVTNYA